MRLSGIAFTAGLGAAALGLASCAVMSGGPLVTEDREVTDTVTAVVLNGSGTLNLTRSKSPSLQVTAGENIIDRVVTEVDGDVLRLDLRGTIIGNLGSITYDLALPSVTALTLDGSGDISADVSPGKSLELTLDGSGTIRVREIDVERLTAVLSGSGNITTSGSATTADLLLDGSGNVRAADLEITDATAELGGSGTMDVTASGTLLAILSGSGTITYAGDARVTEEITGSGDIRER